MTRTIFFGLLLVILPWAEVQQPKKEIKPSLKTAEDLLKPGPRPKKPPLPESELPLKFVKGERIAFVGNQLASDMSRYGHFEAMLHYRHPDLELVIRNFGRPADEVANRQRSSDYTKLDDPLYAFNPDTIFCFFGFNESFAGPEGVEKFKADYEKFLDEFTKKYPRDDAGSPPRFIIVTPPAFNRYGDINHFDNSNVNNRLHDYAKACIDIAIKRQLASIDLFDATKQRFANNEQFDQNGKRLLFTNDGFHLTEVGSAILSERLISALAAREAIGVELTKFRKIHAAVVDKSWIHQQDYRMLNGWYVYGGRRTFDTETFPREIAKIRKMCEVRDRYIWDIAQGKPVPEKPDDSKTGELIVPATRFGDPRQKYSEELELKYLAPDEFIKTCTMPEGFKLELFADEKMFPEIAKPVQMNFDNRGRLWVATMPSYPLWRPGDPRPADKLVILEDTQGTGKADKCTVFYDKLTCPTGFEFWNGGVIVVDQPRLLFLKDTKGTGKADLVVELLDGFASDDTHHTIGAFEWSHGGYLQMLEGVSMSTAVETPHGPFRNFGTSGAYQLDPRTLKLTHYNTPGYGNPWCYVYNEWGQGFVGDGTGAAQHWDTLLSGAQYPGRRGIDPTIDPKGMRPVVGSEFLRTRQFPDEVQNQFIFACVINMNGLTRFDVKEDGSGYKGTRTADLLKSTHKHFRPVDPQIGPDGALWFGDWANALIGHMQYSQRDPNRNHDLGRIYRLVYTKKPLLKLVTQADKTIPELLEQLKEYENRTRYRARRELWARPTKEVSESVLQWMRKLIEQKEANYERLICEALWVMQGHRQVDKFIGGILELPPKYIKDENARAAIIKIVADERDSIRQAELYLRLAAVHPSPRVRIEAVRGLSFYKDPLANESILEAAKMPMDVWMRYVVQSSLGATESVWRPYYYGKQIGQDPVTGPLLDEIINASKTGAQAAPWLKQLLGPEALSQEQKNKAMRALADIPGGNAGKGRQVFKNATCITCHKIGGEGQDYGPELTHIMSQQGRNRFKLIESVIDPNAEVDEKYRSTKVEKQDGGSVSGLLISKPGEFPIVIFDGKVKQTIAKDNFEKLTVLKQSSMPEGLAGTISPAEFLDLIEYLASLK